MREYLRADLATYCRKDFSTWAKCRVIRQSYGFRATVVYRFGQWVDVHGGRHALSPLWQILSRLYHCLNWMVSTAFGIRMDTRAVIGKGFHIYHFGGIVVGSCRIGDNCTIHQHVRLGESEATGVGTVPTIGNNVWIGPHARVVLPVTVGDNVTISAGAVVTRDIKDNCLVGGNPARVINPNFDNRALFRRRIDGPAEMRHEGKDSSLVQA